MLVLIFTTPFIAKEISARLSALNRQEVIEYRMTQQKGHNYRHRGHFYHEHKLGQPGDIDAFTTKEYKRIFRR